jgi:hypothetical protein
LKSNVTRRYRGYEYDHRIRLCRKAPSQSKTDYEASDSGRGYYCTHGNVQHALHPVSLPTVFVEEGNRVRVKRRLFDPPGALGELDYLAAERYLEL